MDFTGERFTPDSDVDMHLIYEHKHRYEWLSNIVKDKNIIDIACGEGYGSHILSESASSVIGIDISDEAVKFAQNKYSNAQNLFFKTGSVTNIPIDNNAIDIMVSFETIEHIYEHEEMLSESRRVLKNNGILIVSTPDKKIYTDDSGEVNDFHVKELYRQEFFDLLKKYYPHVKIYGQRFITLSSIEPEGDKSGQNEIIGNIKEQDSKYLIAVCSLIPQEIPELSGSLYFNEQYDIFSKDKNKLKWASSVHSELMKAQQDYRNLEHNHMQLEARYKEQSHQVEELTNKLNRAYSGLIGLFRRLLAKK